MILYFADRGLTVLGQASTVLPKAAKIENDLKTEDIETGTVSFQCTLHWNGKNEVRNWAKGGNYVLGYDRGEVSCFTIIDTEDDTLEQTTEIYCEDAGMDLLNETSMPFEATESHGIAWYIEKFTYDSGFEIGVNEISDLSRTLSWDGESSMLERVQSCCTQFDNAEFGFSFEISGLRLTKKYINIYKKRGSESGEQFRMNYNVDRIRKKTSIANVATALWATGGTPEESEEPINLRGYTYDDGDIFVLDGFMKSRSALAKWSRYLNPDDPSQTYTGHIRKNFEYDTLSQSELCNRAVAHLKKISEEEINYEVSMPKLPPGCRLGDTVTVIDRKQNLYMSARILKLETSVSDVTVTATLGDYLIRNTNVSDDVYRVVQNALINIRGGGGSGYEGVDQDLLDEYIEEVLG